MGFGSSMIKINYFTIWDKLYNMEFGHRSTWVAWAHGYLSWTEMALFVTTIAYVIDVCDEHIDDLWFIYDEKSIKIYQYKIIFKNNSTPFYQDFLLETIQFTFLGWRNFVGKCIFGSSVMAWTSGCSTKIQCNYIDFCPYILLSRLTLHISIWNYLLRCVKFWDNPMAKVYMFQMVYELLATLISCMLFRKYDNHYSYTMQMYTR